ANDPLRPGDPLELRPHDDRGVPVTPRLVIVSGGQTGADRGALDAALAAGVPCGGWCPRGRRAEDGAIPDRYPLLEPPTAASPPRDRGNRAAPLPPCGSWRAGACARASARPH